MLTQMDAELMSLLQPNTAQKMNYAPATAVPDGDSDLLVGGELSAAEC